MGQVKGQGKDNDKGKGKGALLRAIWQLAAGERLRFAMAVVALLAASVFLYLAPLIPQVTIDGVISPGEAAAESRFVQTAVRWMGGRAFVADNLWWPALLVMLLTVVAGGFTYLRGRWSAQASEGIVRNVRDRLYGHLQRLPCRYHDTASTGDLIQRCTSDVETLRTFLATHVVEIGRAVVMLVMPIPLMLAIDVRMTVASVLLIPFVFAFSLVYFARIRKVFLSVDEAEGRMTTTIQENLTGIRVVRAFARQDYERAKLAERNQAHRDLDHRLYILLAHFWALSDLLCFTQKALVLGVGIYLLAVGELAVGALFFFITVVSMFIWPVRMMGRILADLGKAMVALGRLREILDEPAESDEPGAAMPDQPLRGGVVFDQVSFRHQEASDVLSDVSFRVEPGQTLALLGPSGCGKSTVVNLLLRLYDYDEGSIRLDGFELSSLPRQAVRAQMAVVMQEPFLYSRTLRENLTIGYASASEEEMIEAAATACVHESIIEFESGYDTAVGERGVTLSGGQRQRVALARALLQKPALLLLDDALSAVDAETEAVILDALRRRRGRHTTIVIAHRLATLRHADQILVLDHGMVVQQGTHQALLQEEGLYRRLWTIQNATGEPSASEEATVTHE